MEFLIGGGLLLTGAFLNINQNEYEQKKIEDPSNINKIDKNNKYVQSFPKNYYDNYKSRIHQDSTEFLYKNISDGYKKSIIPDSKIVNNIWRVINDPNEQKEKKRINNLISGDLNFIKKTSNNNIETMNNIEKYNNYKRSNDLDMISSSDDSVFSDNYSLNNITKNIKNYNSDSDNESNINTRVLNQQERFLSDVITNLSGYDTQSNNSDIDNVICSTNSCQNINTETGTFTSQFDELKFDHKGIPNTIQNGKQMLNIFNDKNGWIPQSNFEPKTDGRYNATQDMTHNNMVPFFKSKTYGYNPMYDKERENYSVRQVELFTGSDQNPQFKHKKEVGNLFSPETNKVESVTGVPNFNDYFESRYIPSQTRNGEKPFEPIRTTPGLNLGYTQMGNTGKQDLYRVLPKTVDQLRTVNNPKVSYTPLTNPGQKGDRRGIIGDFIQKGPDRFFYQSPDSMLPQVGDYIAPAIYGKIIVDQTNRSLNPNTPSLNPLGGIEKSTPEYLQGQFKRSFKHESEQSGPTNIQYDTRGQIINQETWVPNDTNRQDTNWGDKHIVNTLGNKTQTYLENFENATPDTTKRELMSELPNTNITGNYKSIPLINFLNYIPDVTKKQILIEDNGNKNITNISNHIGGYLFNSINAIKDPTLRNLISEKIILTNQRGPQEQNYMFNMSNAITDPNMRNLSENNLILTNLSNHEQGYLFNNINAIPDPTLRDIINTFYIQEGLGIKGEHSSNQMFNYTNAIPDTTLRELTENILHLTNTTGPVGSIKQYLFNYIDGVPDTTLRELTQNKIQLNNINGNELKNYLYNYINTIPDTTLRELTENQKYLINQKGSLMQSYIFNQNNAIPDTTMRELIEDLKHITGLSGNHKAQYLLNYINAVPDTTIRELTENKHIISNMNPIQVKDYLYNYINAIPDTTIRELTENYKHLLGQKGSYGANNQFNYDNGIPDPTLRSLTENTTNILGQKGSYGANNQFNYDNGIPDPTLRSLTENTTNILGQKGSHGAMVGFDYDNGIPEPTLRTLTENKTNITGIGSKYAHKEYIFNYENGTPDDTNRNQTGTTKNITGQKGDNTQSRSRLDYSNALLNTTKENIAMGRSPTEVKDNKGPTCMFTQYEFNDDTTFTSRPIYGATKPIGGNLLNPYFTFKT